MQDKLRVLTALYKVFPDETPPQETVALSVLREDVASFQIAINPGPVFPDWVQVAVESPLTPWITVREVKLSPSTYPCHKMVDDNYLRTAPGMFPDRLAALRDGKLFKVVSNQWRALWVDIDADRNTPAGTHDVTVVISDTKGTELARATVPVTVIGCVLPPLSLYHTEWFHADCLADYYGLSTESDAFFAVVESFIRTAVKRGVNTILTPLFTPPLDTAEGGERTTMQLVDVWHENGAYRFGFDRLRRWIEICNRCGVRTLEMSHLFSQWGAKYAPKVMSYEAGEYVRLFGWHTPGTGDAYKAFLGSFLPALLAELKSLGVLERCLFHISDEPSPEHFPQYKQARDIVRPFLEGLPVVDALSDYALYQNGDVDIPAVATNHIEPFLDAKVPTMWAYYCTSQCLNVSNRFFSMPSARNRVIGVQLYRHQVKGFLQWGYNFYNSQYSLRHIDPYAVTDADDAFPSGDSFIVYPGEGGKPEESIRLMVLQQAFSDVRALTLLESLTDRKTVEAMIDEGLNAPLTFSEYPHDDAYLLNLRARVNEAIAARL